jgi:hypothetical protein
MAAKLSERVQHLVEEASELPSSELDALIEAIQRLPRGDDRLAERHAVIAERAARVRAGQAETLSLDEVEQSIRRDLDF